MGLSEPIQPWIVTAPLAGTASEPPDYRQKVPLVCYRPPEWKRELISDAREGVLHGIFVTDWDQDGRDEVLTASFPGIHLFRYRKDGAWTQTELTKGSPQPWPECGSSDVAVGRLGRRRFLCAIEPWHGNQVVVYTQKGKTWQRHLIDDTLANGHTIQAADLNGDGRDEIIAGGRDKPYNVYIYSAQDSQGSRWSRQILDEGGMGPAACTLADLNADGSPAIACIGATTLKWYENLRGAGPRPAHAGLVPSGVSRPVDSPGDVERTSAGAQNCAAPPQAASWCSPHSPMKEPIG